MTKKIKIRREEVPKWYIIFSLIIFSLIILSDIVYKLIANTSQIVIMISDVIVAICLLTFFIVGIFMIIKTIRNKSSYASIILSVFGLCSFIIPFMLYIPFFGVSSDIVNLIAFIFPFVPLMFSINLLVKSNFSGEKEYSNHLTDNKLVFLTVISLGTYKLVWLFKNWKDLEENTREDISAWNYICFFIPIVNFFMFYHQFERIKFYVKEKLIKVEWSPGWITFWFIILATMPRLSKEFNGFLGLAILIGLTFVSIIPMIIIQDTLNDFWDKTQAILPKRRFFDLTDGETVAILIGVVLWVIIIPSYLD